MDVELPLLTRILLGISDFFLHYWWLFALIVVGGYVLIKSFIRSPSFKLFWDKSKLELPIIGPFTKELYMARFSRSLETLIAAGLSITSSLKIAKNTINNSVYEKALDKIEQEVENGSELATVMKMEKCFPPMMPRLIGIGEKSGKLDFVLGCLAEYFERDVETTARNLTTILEPILTIIMGIGIALVVASVIMPIYGLVNAI